MAEVATVELHTPASSLSHPNSYDGCPVNRIPVEVLAEILTIATGSQDVFPARIYMCLVCKHWAEVAMDTAVLWNCVEIIACLRTPLHQIRTRLERSKDAPLSLTVVDDSSWDAAAENAQEIATGDDEHVLGLVDIIAPHFWRCKFLKFETGKGLAMKSALEALRTLATPLLRDLSLQLKPDGRPAIHHDPIPLLQGGAPLLQFLHLERTNIQWQGFIPQAFNVQSLCLAAQEGICGPSARRLLSILTSLPHLTKLSLDSIEPEYDNVGSDFPSLSRLEELLISRSQCTFITKVIQGPSVNLSNLRRLHLNCYDPGAGVARPCSPLLSAFSLHFTSIPSSLRLLRFDYCNFDDGVLTTFVARHDGLEEIMFHHCNVSSGFLDFLSGIYPVIAPNLTKIGFYFCPDISGESLLRLVRARTEQQAMARLRSVKVHQCRGVWSFDMNVIHYILEGEGEGA